MHNLNLTYSQLTLDTALAAEDLIQIARLVYETDQYISEALFPSLHAALTIIPALYKRQDALFSCENTFVARMNKKIIGLILWKQGPLVWSPNLFVETSVQCGFPATPLFQKVCKEYFAGYSLAECNTTSLINVCIDNRYRGKGVATRTLEKFLEKVPPPLELHVLADNTPAIRLYESAGFRKTACINGFSVDDHLLPCFRMQKS